MEAVRRYSATKPKKGRLTNCHPLPAYESTDNRVRRWRGEFPFPPPTPPHPPFHRFLPLACAPPSSDQPGWPLAPSAPGEPYKRTHYALRKLDPPPSPPPTVPPCDILLSPTYPSPPPISAGGRSSIRASPLGWSAGTKRERPRSPPPPLAAPPSTIPPCDILLFPTPTDQHGWPLGP